MTAEVASGSGLVFALPYIFIFLIILALISFFFSASETALIGLSKIRLRHMVLKGIKRARNVQNLAGKLDKFIAAILIGNDFVNIAISAIATAIFVEIFGYHRGVIISTFAATFFVLIFCEITPKMLAVKHTEKIALFTAPIMEGIIKILHPVIMIFTGTSNLILKVLRIQPQKRSPLVTEEEIRMMIEIGKEEGVLTDEERKMLYRIFEFGDTKVEEAMIPKAEMFAIDIKSEEQEIFDLLAEEGHARIPVYEGSIDKIVGIIYARDLLYMLRDKQLFLLQDVMHKPYFIPASTRVNEVLKKFQMDKIQIAVVVDSDNNTLGMVTLEDLIEEIVGEIEEDPAAKLSGGKSGAVSP